MILLQAMAKKLKVLAMFCDISALETALDDTITDKKELLKVACGFCEKNFKYRSTMLEHVALKHKKDELLEKFAESSDDLQLAGMLACCDLT